MLRGCVALDTGISVPEWRQAVEAICNRHHWPIRFYATTDSYERIVKKYGFPGPGKHGMFMNYLKGRAVRVFKKNNPGAVLASGVRRAESARRAVNTRPISWFEGVKIIAPLWDMTTDDVWSFARSHGYERPESYSRLQISGDCLCGSFAEPDERAAISYWYPAIDARLRELEAVLPEEEKNVWGWGCNRPRRGKSAVSVVCVDCDKRG